MSSTQKSMADRIEQRRDDRMKYNTLAHRFGYVTHTEFKIIYTQGHPANEAHKKPF